MQNKQFFLNTQARPIQPRRRCFEQTKKDPATNRVQRE